jgi:protocatechuate 3,4-dioxygenase beta subunit
MKSRFSLKQSSAQGLTRRAASIALVAAPVIWTSARAQPAPARRLTPSQTEGPFYPVALPADADNDLLRHGTLVYTRGQPSWVQGIVMDLAGQPVRGAQVEIWQCDHAGHYDHPGDGGRIDKAFQGFGRTSVDAEGRYRFRTIRPVAYSGRTPHIHVKVKLGTRELLTTQLYVEGEPLNEKDFLWRRLPSDEARALTVAFSPGPDRLLSANFNVVVRA